MLLDFKNKTNIEMMVLLNAFWIRFRIVKCRFVKYRFVRYTFRFVRYRLDLFVRSLVFCLSP